jgi:aryl-alcohol dehydrogenase-like predicted oxidoreductase
VQFGLAYGVSNTTGQVSMQEARHILDEAKNCGMDTLDTAIAYGESETVLGQLGIDGWHVVSKLPALPTSADDVAGWVQAQFAASLQRLGVSHLEGLLLHRPDQLKEPGGDALWAALLGLREQGLVRRIGVSIYSHEELPELTAGRHFDLVQAPLNILDRSLVDSGWAQRLKEQGTELHVRSAFLQGLLLMGPDRPTRFARWQPLWQQWHDWLGLHGLSPLQASLRYCLSLPQVDRVVVGVESAAQLREIVDAAQGDLPPPPDWCMPVDPMLVNPAKWNQL